MCTQSDTTTFKFHVFLCRFVFSGEVDPTFVKDDGSFFFPNITEKNTTYASRDGVEYYCTANNSFGTIRSKTVKAFYACKLSQCGSEKVDSTGTLILAEYFSSMQSSLGLL